MRIVGIDPGLANTGVAVIDGPGDADVAALEYYGTAPNRQLPQSLDDYRRCMRQFAEVYGCLAAMVPQPTHVVVEWYAPYRKQTRGWTTAIVVGGYLAICMALGIKVRVAAPPRHVQVARWPKGQPPVAQGQRDHILDALTHARLEWHRRTARKPTP